VEAYDTPRARLADNGGARRDSSGLVCYLRTRWTEAMASTDNGGDGMARDVVALDA